MSSHLDEPGCVTAHVSCWEEIKASVNCVSRVNGLITVITVAVSARCYLLSPNTLHIGDDENKYYPGKQK